ncbi:uncharacterized protein LOC117783854 [Drosophila innubila]|uniref:uncharacterized protein LOC117783854 n=1 Tax=Drosophila innubila TaxID=198719 RepID=UPI00148B4978|nr:uncharacterized protein LOC117783854 [Drosophila innubila]
MVAAPSENKSNAEENAINLAAVAILSDCDDISDIDGEDLANELHKTLNSRRVSTLQKSIFNTTLDFTELPAGCQQIDAAVKAFKAHVEQEKASWHTLCLKNPVKPSGAPKPSQEQQEYLNKGPNIKNIMREFGAFMNKGTRFLVESEEMLDLVEDVKDECRKNVRVEQNNNIMKCLSKFKKNEF